MSPDTLARRGALDELMLKTAACPAAELRAVPPMARLLLRGRPAAIEAIAQATGIALPQIACRSAVADRRAALWLGPDEWLLLAPDDETRALFDLVQSAAAPISLTDIGHRHAAFEIEGPQAAVLLNHGCPLDLSHEAFPAGACTRTLFAKAEIVLWRRDAARFWVETGRSFAPYVWELLVEARRAYENGAG